MAYNNAGLNCKVPEAVAKNYRRRQPHCLLTPLPIYLLIFLQESLADAKVSATAFLVENGF